MSHYNPEDGGIQFDPYDDELIKNYLIPKLRGELCPSGGKIVMKDVYAKEPWLLDHTRDCFFKKNEWYYFTTRTQVSVKKIGRGQNVKRRITGDNDGRTWKANAHEGIIDEETREIIGQKQTLKFTDSNGNGNKKMQKRGDGTCCDLVPGSESSWIMTEYMLPEGDGTFQTLVLCKIHVVKKSKKKDNDHESFSLSVKQLINEAHRHDAEIPSVGSEKNDDQVIFCKIQESNKSKKKDDHHEASTSEQQQPMNIDSETVLSPSLEQQQQPSLCGPENPHMRFPSSVTCSAAETERNKEQSGEGNMINQIDAFSAIETVPERSSHKDGKFEATEVTKEGEEDWIGYASNGLEALLLTNTEDQQEPPIFAPAHMNVVASARLGAKSLPEKLDEDSESYKEWEAAFVAMIREEEDAPFKQWWDSLLNISTEEA